MKRLLFLSLMVCASVLAVQKPNVLLILADDLGYNDTGFQGSNMIKTPSSDRSG